MKTESRSSVAYVRTVRRTLLRAVACKLLLIVDLALAAPGIRDVPAAEIDALFAGYDSTVTPGCALGVMHQGAFVYRRGYGMANLEHGVPISPRSVFRIGSTSKQFTAVAIALLAEAALLKLDDPLRAFFPEFPPWARQVTVRQLIHHTSGIRDYLTLAQLAGRGGEADHYTDSWVLKLLARQRETNFPPGSQYLYSNSGYLLLAHIVRRASDEGLRAFSEKRIFEPLDMNDTHFHDDHTHIVPRRATGYAPAGDGFRISMTTLEMVGDGGIYTTIDDLLAWDRNFYDNRLGKGGPELIRQLTTPGMLDSGETLDYAFGLGVQKYRGLPMISHGGSFVGYRADLLRFPEQRFSVAVLCNRADANPSALGRSIADLYLSDLLLPAPESTYPAGEVELTEDELQRYAGDFWEDEEAFLAQTRVIDGELWAMHSPERRDRLVPVESDRFRMIGPPALVLIDFEFDADGLVRMTRTIDGRPSGVFRPIRLREADAEVLREYAGRYHSPELDVSYEVAVTDDQLLFRIGSGEPRPLSPVFGDVFENPDFGAFTFLRGADQKVRALELQSGRVRNLVFQRR